MNSLSSRTYIILRDALKTFFIDFRIDAAEKCIVDLASADTSNSGSYPS